MTRPSATAASAVARPAGGAPVTFSGVTCRYGRRTVVHSVDLAVDAGEHVALTGANGSGKTTLLRTVLGLHPLAAGAVSVDGVVAAGRDGWARRRREVAWVPQRLTPGHFPLLVQELLASGGAPAAAADAADALGVGGLDDRPLHTLSGGQLQRVFLARAFGAVAAGARALLADEPTAALDFGGQEQVAGLLAGLPVTVIVVSHDRAMSRACDRVAEMAAGTLRVV
ncbi:MULTISPECIES: ATP-binding cassette domain-containing protein [unclassified Solwaraspora]|uniref:metal ABC transporter ATP-binding protein n=1 Tax=unclassified Solwaraspora TaxID=2627926 RepID=UPI00248D06E7|nr:MULTISPECIES: ATP-binding cassette domain-containing protein [unclassified Solwaraspora]WBB98904.1 ATP-binding cassette domain-containing protein [Solwaraspora sp. WMMA2059]WBC22543.1 ATP-binding cassette domain-containing protein [Solwaraspora sp. WMMA2080]WJK35403.1 ATP-binding cassette domain-containing protein [Solwaraspora sp. WMMA2065]